MLDDHDDEEVMGEPTFELRLRDGEPQVSGCYFMHPVLQTVDAAWDSSTSDRILVTADDGSRWYADRVPRVGTATVRLQPLEVGRPPLKSTALTRPDPKP